MLWSAELRAEERVLSRAGSPGVSVAAGAGGAAGHMPGLDVCAGLGRTLVFVPPNGFCVSI